MKYDKTLVFQRAESFGVIRVERIKLFNICICVCHIFFWRYQGQIAKLARDGGYHHLHALEESQICGSRPTPSIVMSG